MTLKKKVKIAIVEDDLFFNKSIERLVQNVCSSQAYSDFHFEIKTYLNAYDCMCQLEPDTDIMFLDYYLINVEERKMLNGYHVLNQVKEKCTDCKVVMVSSLKNFQTAVEMMRRGAYEFVTKGRDPHHRIGEVLQGILSQKLHAMKSHTI